MISGDEHSWRSGMCKGPGAVQGLVCLGKHKRNSMAAEEGWNRGVVGREVGEIAGAKSWWAFRPWQGPGFCSRGDGKPLEGTQSKLVF